MEHIRNVRHPIFEVAYGMISDMTKVNSHCEAAPLATPMSLVRLENISSKYNHGRGLHDIR